MRVALEGMPSSININFSKLYDNLYINILRRMEIWNGRCQILRDCASSVRTRPKI